MLIDSAQDGDKDTAMERAAILAGIVILEACMHSRTQSKFGTWYAMGIVHDDNTNNNTKKWKE